MIIAPNRFGVVMVTETPNPSSGGGRPDAGRGARGNPPHISSKNPQKAGTPAGKELVLLDYFVAKGLFQ